MTDISVIKILWAHGNQHIPGLIEGAIAAAPTVFPKYGLNTPLVIAHAMAQFSHECGAGLEMVENLNYRADQLHSQWPTHFSASMAERYAHNPRAIADIAYGGRMGNAPPPSDDGWNYRGRGFPQTTGKDEYERLGAKVGLDLVSNPDLVNDPDHALECGVANFILCNCLAPAEQDDVIKVTKALNGGTIGLSSRIQWLVKWKKALIQ
jgi:putative chitinase